MAEVRNGMPATQLSGLTWRKSSRSGARGNCVELANVAEETVAVRNSRYPSGPALVYSRAQMDAFLAATKNGTAEHAQT